MRRQRQLKKLRGPVKSDRRKPQTSIQVGHQPVLGSRGESTHNPIAAKRACLFDESGMLVNETTRQYLLKFMNAFSEWVEKNAVVGPRLKATG